MTWAVLPRTLRTRLTALIVLATCAVLVLVGVALYEALRNYIEATASVQMAGTLAALEEHLAGLGTPDQVRLEADIWRDQSHGYPNLSLALYDPHDKLLFGTTGFLPNDGILAVRRGVEATFQSADRSVRYRVKTVPLGSSAGPPIRVAVQYDRRADLALLRSYQKTIVAIELIGVLLTAGLAYGIALLGLAPLRRLIACVKQMSSSRLAQPFPELGSDGELEELEHAFNGMLGRLNESFTRLSEFSSNLAHDMRTPLTNLQAAAQVALAQPRSADCYKDVIESSIDEYQRLSRMIDDMLFLARAEQSSVPLELRRLDATAEAARVAGYYEPMAADAEVTIQVHGWGGLDADLGLYQRALSNLLSNALAYAPRGTAIDVDCRERDDATVIAVSDAGAGIETQHLGRVFDRFYRADPSRHNSASGTGLGLAIVKSIMDAHGGVCGAESEPGVRTTFWLNFPRGAGREPPGPPPDLS
jgi:two-component system heavy metal sensor histidine kinase CusS